MTTLALALGAVLASPTSDAAAVRPFAVKVVDDQSGRGVPLVELATVHKVRFVTDSAGVAAIAEPGLMGTSVYFHVKSHGYEYPRDGFGFRGKALRVVEGGSETLKVRRINVAERLYRVTGAGIYRDSILVGRPAPIARPLLNARVFGQDTVLTARYRGKLYWFWGDTDRPDYPLGNYNTPGATSELPGRGGLDPEVGVDLTYFVDDATGFARATAPLPGDGPTWLTGLAAFEDETGAERLVAGYAKVKPNMRPYEHGLVVFDPARNVFEKAAVFSNDAALRPDGHVFTRVENGVTYLYYANPFPLVRVRARLDDLKDATHYEGFTALATGSRRKAGRLDNPRLEVRDGHLDYAWRPNTPVASPEEEPKILAANQNADRDPLVALRDVETDAAIVAHRGSTHWNAHRERWVMIAVQKGGATSFLGEVWYAEADTPLGPWAYARKVVTHDRYSFYNPLHHPEFDRDGGRVIYFEGTYTTTFSRDNDPTPRYDYNQIMYRLDLDDPRLNLPAAVYRQADGTYAAGPAAARGADGAAPAFFALERPGAGTVAVVATPDGLRVGDRSGRARAAFHALAADAKDRPRAAVPLRRIVSGPGVPDVHVWPARSGAKLPGG